MRPKSLPLPLAFAASAIFRAGSFAAANLGKLNFEFRGGAPVLLKLPAVDLIDDKEGKPIGIQTHIGRRPIIAFGSSNGGREVLRLENNFFVSEMNPSKMKGCK